ncbi:cysteinyl-tRNA synthetase [Spiroplasma sp. TIUS-1]|uniref:cysteine--tRNA ligase n=1 Tax=Spiroplasma sp. TIUS-1 TaxID=216963 RepID=UPI001396E59D|nr:cysteine--tRNA ligase [Spiroplasma sp. TIUS-1]QHX35582.1 cysteinyl-tRNA synthetase [Spiroplasma sp. TIUS-1]
MKILDSISNKKIDLNNKSVKIYTCGPTVYSNIHIGNARPILLTDTLVRFLSYKNIDVEYMMNITDIDDKIINKAISENTTESEITKKYTDEFIEDLEGMNIIMPNRFVKVSEEISTIEIFIKKLVDAKKAYVKNGSVYFDLKNNLNTYGYISKQKIDQLISEEISNEKNDPLDFALWKSTSIGLNWDSQFGKGRPGWHTECVALIDKYFKKSLDLHVGGIDLKFPHHENERIQFYSLYKTELSKIWMHNGSLNVNKEKMSKSLGNIVNLRDFLKVNSPNILRLLMLKINYSNPLSITDKDIEDANKWISKVTNTIKQSLINSKLELIKEFNLNYLEEFDSYMNDNLNTGQVITLVDKIVKEINSQISKKEFSNLYLQLIKILEVLGIKFKLSNINEKEITLLKNWKKYINEKQFNKADEIRSELIELGVL